MKKRICFITPGHICGNPRLIKEAKACSGAGYEVVIMAAQYMQKLIPFDVELTANNPQWEVKYVQNQEIKKWRRLKSSLRYKTARLFWKNLKLGTSQAVNRFWYEQKRIAKETIADLYIAHNLAALPVAAYASKFHQKPFAFDAEDFHRQESEMKEFQRNLIVTVEDQYLPQAGYVSAASPLIAKAYRALYHNQSFCTINNVFSLCQQPTFKCSEDTDKLRLFWFSQTIGLDRGIQDVIAGMNLLPKLNIELTLVGAASEKVKQALSELLQSKQQTIHFLDTVSENKLIQMAAHFDVGLALERKNPPNRNICLTNKLFVYLLAGNAILASSTDAQQKFLSEHKGIGEIYLMDKVESLAKILSSWYFNKQALNQVRQNAWNLANSQLNWEVEQQSFLALIQKTLA